MADPSTCFVKCRQERAGLTKSGVLRVQCKRQVHFLGQKPMKSVVVQPTNTHKST